MKTHKARCGIIFLFFIVYCYLFSFGLPASGFDIRVDKTPSETPGGKLQMLMWICMRMCSELIP